MYPFFFDVFCSTLMGARNWLRLGYNNFICSSKLFLWTQIILILLVIKQSIKNYT